MCKYGCRDRQIVFPNRSFGFGGCANGKTCLLAFSNAIRNANNHASAFQFALTFNVSIDLASIGEDKYSLYYKYVCC